MLFMKKEVAANYIYSKVKVMSENSTAKNIIKHEPTPLVCSFCSATPTESEYIITIGTAHICTSCIEVCNNIIANRRKNRAVKKNE